MEGKSDLILQAECLVKRPLLRDLSEISDVTPELVQEVSNENRQICSKYNDDLAKGMKIYTDICLSRTLPAGDKLLAIVSFYKNIPDEGIDMLCRWRDMIPYLKDEELIEHIKLMVAITRSAELDSHQRVITAVTLYNLGFISECYKCFSDLSCDRSVLVNYRVEASRYLFATEDDNYQQIAIESLTEIIESMAYPSEYRYNVIAGFISRTGINTILNATKLRIPYDESFVYPLQRTFFYNEHNGIRERILSGQHLLQMETVGKEEKEKIVAILIDVANDENYSHEVRADAADVIYREGSSKMAVKAREIITKLGYSSVDTSKGSLLDRTRTIYTNAENVHNETIAKSVEKFIEYIIKEEFIQGRPYHEIHQEVKSMIDRYDLTLEQRHNALKALNRISIDTAMFSKYKTTIAEIFMHVWTQIKRLGKEELEKALIEELVDMGDTCSSGHSGRLINVLSRDIPILRIGWDDQIIANMSGRLNARIRDCTDEEMRVHIALGQMEGADEKDVQAYKSFLKEQLVDLKEELKKEFVGEGYVPTEEFERIFEQGCSNWF